MQNGVQCGVITLNSRNWLAVCKKATHRAVTVVLRIQKSLKLTLHSLLYFSWENSGREETGGLASARICFSFKAMEGSNFHIAFCISSSKILAIFQAKLLTFLLLNEYSIAFCNTITNLRYHCQKKLKTTVKNSIFTSKIYR